MKSSYGAVFTDFFNIVWGRFDRKWAVLDWGRFLIVAVLTGNPETANVVTRDFLEYTILSILNGYCVSRLCKEKRFFKLRFLFSETLIKQKNQ